jgi:hypothetical protein
MVQGRQPLRFVPNIQPLRSDTGQVSSNCSSRSIAALPSKRGRPRVYFDNFDYPGAIAQARRSVAGFVQDGGLHSDSFLLNSPADRTNFFHTGLFAATSQPALIGAPGVPLAFRGMYSVSILAKRKLI